jgi:hypothetical protein
VASPESGQAVHHSEGRVTMSIFGLCVNEDDTKRHQEAYERLTKKIQEEPKLTLLDILKTTKSGAKICRKAWTNGFFLRQHAGVLYIQNSNDAAHGNQKGLAVESLTANDWYVMEEKLVTQLDPNTPTIIAYKGDAVLCFQGKFYKPTDAIPTDLTVPVMA